MFLDALTKKLEAAIDKTTRENDRGRHWDYIVDVVARPEALQPLLISRGNDRWELVSFSNSMLVFKRPKPSPQE
jgi:hypothetical protein